MNSHYVRTQCMYFNFQQNYTDRNNFEDSYYVVSKQFPRFQALGVQNCFLFSNYLMDSIVHGTQFEKSKSSSLGLYGLSYLMTSPAEHGGQWGLVFTYFWQIH